MREVRYYAAFAETGRPLVVFVQGSGTSSVFHEQGGQAFVGYGASSLVGVVDGKCALIIVEKPGVEPFSSEAPPGSATFRKEHTLPRWSEAVAAAIQDYTKRYSPKKVCVIGHSEGGLVAAHVSNMSRSVSHVASVAGGGPNFLHDLLVFARRGGYFRAADPDVPAQVKYVTDAYQRIMSDPDDADKTFFGHAYPRWSSWLSTSVEDELRTTKALAYIAQGTLDDAVDVHGVDVAYAELTAAGKNVVYDRVEGADHSFNIDGAEDGWRGVFVRIVAWFLK